MSRSRVQSVGRQRLWPLAVALFCGCSSAPTGVPLHGDFKIINGALGSAPASLALGDCNEDGLLDVANSMTAGGPVVMPRQRDGSLGTPLPLPHPELLMQPDGISFADLDGDGHQDLVIGAQSAWVAHGHGDCTFDTPVQVSQVYFSDMQQVQVTDVDLDGLPDIALMGTGVKGPVIVLLTSRGDGTFSSHAPVTPQVPPTYTPYGTYWDDLDGDGTRDMLAEYATDFSWLSWGVPGDVPTFQIDPDLSAIFSARCPMSVAALDYNRDGVMDYFIAHEDDQSLLVSFSGRQMINRAKQAQLATTDLAGASSTWSTYAFDADLDGWVDLLSLRTKGDQTTSLAAFFHNNRDGTFSNVRKQVLHNFSSDAIRMICGDVLGNGGVVCYAQPPDGPPVVIENHLQPAGNWVGLRLIGTVSSPEAEGARVSVTGASPPQLYYYGAQAPTDGSHDRGLMIPVGTKSSVDLDVTWPSGLHQHVSALPAGQYTTVAEPKVLTVSKRSVAADGQSTVDVTADPSQLPGLGDAAIDHSGEGTWKSEAVQANGVWTRTLIAPTTQGNARIEASFGGQKLLVRPRIVFKMP